MEEVGYVDQFVEPNIEPAEQLEVVAEDIPKLVDVGMEIGFHDQLVEFDMEIVEHSVVDDLVVVGDDLYVAEHLVVSNEIAGVVSLEYVTMKLHIAIDMGFVVASVDSLVVDMDEGLLMKHYVQFVFGSDHDD